MFFPRVKMRLFAVSCLATLSLAVTLAGCSEPLQQEVTDLGLVRSLVFTIGDAAADIRPDNFESLFVEGAVPKATDRSKYGAPLVFKLRGDPEISGEEVILNVKVLRTAPNAEPQVVADVQWTAVKVNGDWKFKSAPLP